LIDRGLRETRGSYRALVRHFNLPPHDYKRFHAFLFQHGCNLSVTAYRLHRHDASASEPPPAQHRFVS
jgi:hypothetical protein